MKGKRTRETIEYKGYDAEGTLKVWIYALMIEGRRLHIQHSKFRLDIQSALLRNDQEISIGVDRSSILHGRIRQVYVCCTAFP